MVVENSHICNYIQTTKELQDTLRKYIPDFKTVSSVQKYQLSVYGNFNQVLVYINHYNSVSKNKII